VCVPQCDRTSPQGPVADGEHRNGQDRAEEAKEVGGRVAEGAKEVGATVKEGAKEVASDVGARKQTVDVKAGLMAAKGIDASHIDVDTDADTKTVTLKGTVPTAAPTTNNLRPITRRRIAGGVCRTVQGLAGR